MRPFEPSRRKAGAAIFASLLLPTSLGCQPGRPPESAPTPDRVGHSPGPAGRGEVPETALGNAPAPTNRHYSWDDLQALEKQEAWAELREHLEDIAPGERTQAWHSLVERAAVASLVDDGNADPLAMGERADALARRYPSLKGSERFRAAAGDVAVRAVGSCASDSSSWARCPSLVTLLEKVVRDPKKTARAADAAVQGGHRQLAMALHRSSTDATAVCASDQALTLAMEGRGKAPDSTFREDAEAVLATCRKLKEKK